MASPEPHFRSVLRVGLFTSVAGLSVLSMLAPSAAAPPRNDHAAQPPANAAAAAFTTSERDLDRRGPEPARYPKPAATPADPRIGGAAVVHESVAPARPTRFRFAGHGFDVTGHVCAMPNSVVLTPPGDARRQVCWVEPSMGEKPGSATATSYILGHSFADDPKTLMGPASRQASAQIAKAPITMRSGVPTRNVHALDGATVTLWTAEGRLDYRVRDSFAVPKPQFGLIDRIEDDSIARRVVLVTCAVHDGRNLDYNIIVEAFLTASRRA